MDKKELEQKVEEFLQSGSEEYQPFWINLGHVPGRQTVRNTNAKAEILKEREDKTAEKKWMDNGIYGNLVGQPPYQELDFEKFSFKFLKHIAEKKGKEDIVKAAEVIQKQNESYRRKKLRHYFYRSLRCVDCIYFDMELYLDVQDRIIEVRERVKELLEEQGVNILTMGYDSYSFISTEEEAQKVQQTVNSELEVARLHRTTYDSALKFYNIALFKEPEGWKMVKLGGTDYDEVKELIAHSLTTLDFEQAYNHVKQAKQKGEYNSDKLREYVSVITEIKREVNRNK